MTHTHSNLTAPQRDYQSRLFVPNYGNNWAEAMNALASLPTLGLPAPLTAEVQLPFLPNKPCTVRIVLHKDREGRFLGAYRQALGGGMKVEPNGSVPWLHYAVSVDTEFPNGVPCRINASVPMNTDQVTRWYRSTYGPQDAWDGDVIVAYRGHYDIAMEIHS